MVKPTNMFDHNDRFLRLLISPREEGIGPVNELFPRYKYSILVNKEISGGMTPVRKEFSSLLQKKKKIDNKFHHMIIDLVIQAGE
jgi:hypothetical protein